MQPIRPAVQFNAPFLLRVKSEPIPDSELFLPLDGVEILGAVVPIEGASIEAYLLAAMGKALASFAHSCLRGPECPSVPRTDGRHGHPYKATLEVRAFIFESKRDNTSLSVQEIVKLILFPYCQFSQ